MQLFKVYVIKQVITDMFAKDTNPQILREIAECC